MSKSRESVLKSANNWTKLIQSYTGIHLDWRERAALMYYFDCFYNRCQNITTYGEAAHCFMLDYFGLNMIDLDKTPIKIKRHGKIIWINYGMGLLRDERFKEYCQKRLNEWREERTLP